MHDTTQAVIESAPLCGGSPTIVGSTDDRLDACASPALPPTLALGASDVYFVDSLGVEAVPAAAGSIATLSPSSCGQAAMGLVLDGDVLFWMTSPLSATANVASIHRLPPGGAPSVVADGVAVERVASAAVGGNYVWADLNGNVLRIPLAGGSTATLASDQSGRSVAGLAVDDTYVYFALSPVCSQPLGSAPCPNPSPTAAAIERVPIGGGSVTTVATDYAIAGIAVDSSNVYWIDPNTALMAASLSAPSGKATVLAEDPQATLGPALSGGMVYWVSQPSSVKAIAAPPAAAGTR
jgi:hypothetical protein